MHPSPDPGNDLASRYPLLTAYVGGNVDAVRQILEDSRRRDGANLRAGLARDLARSAKKAKRKRRSRRSRLQAINHIAPTAEEQLARVTGQRPRRQKLTEERVAEIARDVLVSDLPGAHAVLHAQGGRG